MTEELSLAVAAHHVGIVRRRQRQSKLTGTYHTYVREKGDSARFRETEPRSLTFEISRCHDCWSVRPSVHTGRIPDTDLRGVADPSVGALPGKEFVSVEGQEEEQRGMSAIGENGGTHGANDLIESVAEMRSQHIENRIAS